MQKKYEVYLACLNRTYQDDLLDESMLGCIYAIVNNYELDMQKEDFRFTKETRIEHRKKFIEQLFNIVYRLINENRANDLFLVIKYLMYKLRIGWQNFNYFLSVIYYKESACKNTLEYHKVIQHLCRRTRYNNSVKPNDNYGLFYQYLTCYKYYQHLAENASPKVLGKQAFFNTYAPIIIGYMYANNNSAEELEQVFKRLVTEYEEIVSHFTLNGFYSDHSLVRNYDGECYMVQNLIDETIGKGQVHIL